MLETVRLVFISFVFWFSKRKYEVKSPSYSGRNISHQSIFLKLYVFTFFFLSLFPFTFFSLSIFHHIHCYTHHTRFPCSFVFLFFFCFFLFFFSFLSLSLVALHKFSDFLLFYYIDPEGQSEREADISC